MPATIPAQIDSPTPKQIGRGLRRSRVAAGISVGDATRYLRTTRQTIYSYERGLTMPPADLYMKMLTLYGVCLSAD